MAEVILPPEETEPEILEGQLPEVEKPTEKSKVISVDFNPLNTKQVTILDTRESFFTTDTDAWIVLNVGDMNEPTGQYSLALINKEDGSIFQRTGDIVQGVAYYKLFPNEIKHAGRWVGQAVITLVNGQTTASRFSFNVYGHILDGKDIREIVIQDFQTLMTQLNDLKDNATNEFGILKNEIEAFQTIVKENEDERQATELGRVAAEIIREENYESKVTAAIVEADVGKKVDNKVAELSPTIQQVTAQLAQTQQQKADKEEVQSSLNLKRDKSVPIGLNDADSDLLTAIQGGTTVEVLSIPRDYSVSPEKTTFITISENRDRLINKTIFLNTYVNPTNGIAYSNEAFSASDYIEVEPSVSYIFWWADIKVNASVSSKAFYDADKSYISGEYSGNPITTPANCKYVRIDINNATSFDNLIMQKGSVKIEDIPNPKLNGIDVEVKSDNLSVEIENLAFVHEPTNKDVFTDKKIYLNTYINPTNNYVGSHATMASSDYIAVEPNMTYVFSKLDGTIAGFGNVIFYDENKAYISGQYSGSPLTTPSGCYFIRVSVNEATTFDNVILQKGNTPSYPLNKKMVTEFRVDEGFYNKKWVVVGDSITEKNFRSTTHYHDYVRSELGFNVVNMGVSGSGYKAREDTNNAFYQRISSVPTDADVITIMGGVNDVLTSQPLGEVTDTNTTTICGCINKTIDNLFTQYPLAHVGLITPLPTADYNPLNQTNPLALLSEKIVEIAKLRGIPCLDLYHSSGLRPWNATVNGTLFSTKESPNGDGLHPNTLGHKFFYCKVREFVKTI